MKFTLLSILFLFLTLSWAQSTHVINIEDATNSDLVVRVGDTVRWVSNSAAINSVLSTDKKFPKDFGSQNIADNSAVYEYVFKAPAVINYQSNSGSLSKSGTIKVSERLSSEQDKFSFKIYPNPVKDRIYFQDKGESKSLDITFYDVLGKVVKTERLNALNIRSGMDVSDLKRGVYLVQIDNGSNSFTQKLIKN
tara:strand:+ start:1255 stop:1836 length:582 start_codon:yes stop_codon:yes gene_type:complete